ncbi:MAG: nuclear transport factor 2 family protein [Saprospiraceae bacterium]|nr:nuclear transport factor 2 family protein [Saprospiraceae bacterium]
MWKFISFALLLGCVWSCKNAEPAEPAPEEKTPAAMAPAEIGDAKYIEIGKAGLNALSSGDVAKWMEAFADNAMYRWNNGDSLVGKQAIMDYWTKRRTEVIETISFTGDIWLPVKVNTPANEYQAPGDWLLCWYRTEAKYKNGKTMIQWIHTDQHFDANGKIDLVIQYVDRASINAAMPAKKG